MRYICPLFFSFQNVWLIESCGEHFSLLSLFNSSIYKLHVTVVPLNWYMIKIYLNRNINLLTHVLSWLLVMLCKKSKSKFLNYVYLVLILYWLHLIKCQTFRVIVPICFEDILSIILTVEHPRVQNIEYSLNAIILHNLYLCPSSHYFTIFIIVGLQNKDYFWIIL